MSKLIFLMEFWTNRQMTTLRSNRVFHHFSKTYFQWQNSHSYVGERCNTSHKAKGASSNFRFMLIPGIINMSKRHEYQNAPVVN